MAEQPQPELPGVDWKATELLKKLDSNQREMSRWLKSKRGGYGLIVVNASRQLGKSLWLCDEVLVFALENPGAQIKYGAKTQKQARKIIRPHFRDLFKLMPEELRPVWNQEDGEYVFANEATITIAGCDRDYAEALAGQHAHIFIIDEGGAVKDLDFIIKEIAAPQTLNTDGRLIICSTPARTGGHAFKSYCEDAKAHGTYLERTIFDNPRITDKKIRDMCELAGGPESSSWQREYLVKHIADESGAGLPEATIARLKSITVTDDQLRVTRSPWVDRYIAAMPMWNPNFTGVVWAHFDYRRNHLVVEDNLILRKLDSLVLAEELRQRCEFLWGPDAELYKCVVGTDEGSMLIELNELGWTFMPTSVKELATTPGGDTARGALAKLRHSITHRRGPKLLIHERCEDLRRQLEGATWDKTRKKFERSQVDGFYPLVSALVALRQDLNDKHDATPENAAGRRAIIHPDYGQVRKRVHDGFRRLFGVKR